MDRLLLLRALALYLPIIAAIAAIVWRKPGSRGLTGASLGFMWNLVWLIPLGRMASEFGWFSFSPGLPSFLGMPIDLWLGWAVFWGALPVLCAPKRLWVAGLVVVWIDLAFMPLMEPVVTLGRSWIIGELMGVGLCLVPGLLLAGWTATDRRLVPRTALQVTLFTALVLGLIPWAVLEARGVQPSDVLGLPSVLKGTLLLLLALPLTVGASAVQEFAKRGQGTPFPWDPPKSLVTTGPYAYVANPMQLAITVALGFMAIVLRDGWFALGSAVAVIFSAGVAGWHEETQLHARFEDRWSRYRSRVRTWLPRWRPVRGYLDDGEALPRLYFSVTCDQCRSVGGWIGRHDPEGLELVAAESSPVSLRRLTYVGADGYRDEGVAAFGRALEHINLAWAVVGWIIRLPILSSLIQLIVDASGGGPREIPRESCPVPTTRGVA